MANNQPIHRTGLLNDTAFSIIAQFQAEYRGLVNYYRMAHNLRQFGILKWIMEQSLTRTLAAKLKVSVPTVYRRYHAMMPSDNGQTYKGIRVVIEREGEQPLVATWGGITLARKVATTFPTPHTKSGQAGPNWCNGSWRRRANCAGRPRASTSTTFGNWPTYGSMGDTPPRWVETMAARKRKTLVLCHTCHVALHAGRLDHGTLESPGEPCDAKVSSTVRRGADGKVPE